MFCPQCSSEYRPEISQCADCGVALVETLPEPETGDPEEELVTVYETNDPALTAMARSILESADIPFNAGGEEVQGLLGFAAAGPTRFQVAAEDAPEAKALLVELEGETMEDIDAHYGSEPEPGS